MHVDDLVQLDALGPSGPYRTVNRSIVSDVTGQPVAALSLVPAGYVNNAMARLRSAHSSSTTERLAAIERAGRLFTSESVAGCSPLEYRRLVSRVAGLPMTDVVAAACMIAQATTDLPMATEAGRPLSSVSDWRHAGIENGRAVWCRRGDVLTVIAAGNHPAVHVFWLQALALGYRVVIRPSTQEPFTPHRLVAALHEGGIGRDQLALLPTSHELVDQLLTLADLGIVYGGDGIARKYAADPAVLVQGPGRAKILITEDTPWEPYVDLIVDSISRHAGTTCVNTTAVLTEHDPAPLAEALAEKLTVLSALPIATEATARQLSRYLVGQVRGAKALLGGDQVAAPLGDGSAVLRPALHLVTDPAGRQLGVELPFPCAWVAPWRRDLGVKPLRGSLVLTALTSDSRLIDAIVEEPSISNIHLGAVPTYWYRSGLPHDGFLSDFLMRSKTIARR